MKKRIKRLFHNQIDRINYSGMPISVLVRNYFVFWLTPFLLLIVLLVRLIRPLILVRFRELMSSRIGHFAGNTEVYLCERDLGMHGKKVLDVFFINSFISNKQLMRMWRRTLCISPFGSWLYLINRVLPGGEEHIVPWRAAQDRDVYGALESTKVHISFTDQEERLGQAFLKKIGIANKSPFVCLLSRSSAYLDAMFPKGSWDYQDHRDSSLKNFIPAAEELTRRGYFVLRMGAVVKERLNTSNPMIIDYAIEHRTDFLDIFLPAKCNFYLGDPCGYSVMPMIFRRPVATVNFHSIEYAPTWCRRDLFIPKKLWLRRQRRWLTFREILGSELGRFLRGEQYERLGIEVIQNTPEEIVALGIEMDQRLKGAWQANEEDEELQKRFWSLFKLSELNRFFLSRIGAKFLRENKKLLE